MTGNLHTLAHALKPTLCGHSMAQITRCVICGASLDPARDHVDTCGAICFKELRIIHLQGLLHESSHQPYC